MASFQISLTPAKRSAGRFIAAVRRELQKALAEEHAARGLTQSAIANELGVNRSVIHRQIAGFENLTLGRVGEIAAVLGREPVFSLVSPTVQGNHFIISGTMLNPATPQSVGSAAACLNGRVFGGTVTVSPIGLPTRVGQGQPVSITATAR